MISVKENHMNTTVLTSSIALSGKAKIFSWVLRILGATVFLAAGGSKLVGVEMMVGIFEQIGFGQWFRYITGLVEVVGAIGLLLPSTVGLGGLLLAITMFCAVAIHLFVIGGSAVPAFGLMMITGAISWLNRASIADILNSIK